MTISDFEAFQLFQNIPLSGFTFVLFKQNLIFKFCKIRQDIDYKQREIKVIENKNPPSGLRKMHNKKVKALINS